MLNVCRIGVVVGVVDHDDAAVGFDDFINYARQGGDELKVKLTLKALLNDLHVQHPEEAAAEAEAECDRAFRLKRQGSVIELELFQRITQVGVFAAVLGVDAAVDHRTGGAVAGQSVGTGTGCLGHGVAHLRVGDIFDAGGEISDIACGKLGAGLKTDRTHMPDLEHLIACAGGLQKHLGVLAHLAVNKTHKDNDATVAVVNAVEDERLQGSIGVALGGWDIFYDIVKHGLDIDAVFGAYLGRIHGENADDILNLMLDPLGVGGGEIDLVDDGQYLKVGVQRKVSVCKRLRLNALRGVNDEHRTLARCQRAADLVVEVDMTRSVDEIQHISLAVLGLVVETDGSCLDGDAALTLKIHVVEDLILHDALLDRTAQLDEPVRQRRLTVVDVSDYRKVPDVVLIYHSNSSSAASALFASTLNSPINAFATSALRSMPLGFDERPSR